LLFVYDGYKSLVINTDWFNITCICQWL